MNASNANLDGQNNTDLAEEELDFHSADIVAQDTSKLFVNVDGVERPKEPTADEKTDAAAVAQPKESRAPKNLKKILIIVAIAIVALGAIAGIGYAIYRIVNHEEIEHEEIVEKYQNYEARLSEIYNEYTKTNDYDAAMAEIESDIEAAKDEKQQVMAKNNKLWFLANVNNDLEGAIEFHDSYCGAPPESLSGDGLCGKADLMIEILKYRMGDAE